MQRQFHISIDGAEIERLDVNSISLNASLAEERVFSEIFRPSRIGTGGVFKGILPYGDTRTHEFEFGSLPIVSPDPSGGARVVVAPFRALIGEHFESGSYDAGHTAVRTAVTPDAHSSLLQLPATVSNNRWDLIVARVDIDVDESSVTRYVRDVNGNTSALPIACYRNNTVELLVITGTEAATPAHPTIFADTPTTFWIPLAYVRLNHPHTLASTISRLQIHEVAQVLSLAPAVGGCDAAPMRWTNRPGATGACATWLSAGGRPREYLPPGMTGKIERYLPLDFTGGHASLALNAVTVLDDSIDWRGRFFKTIVQVNSSGTPAVIGQTAPTPGGSASNVNYTFLGQSFGADYGSSIVGLEGHVCYLNSVTAGVGAGSQIELFVSASGSLCAFVNSVSPNRVLFLWIEATGQFGNA